MTMLTPIDHQPNGATNVKGTAASQSIKKDLQRRMQTLGNSATRYPLYAVVKVVGRDACSQVYIQSSGRRVRGCVLYALGSRPRQCSQCIPG